MIWLPAYLTGLCFFIFFGRVWTYDFETTNQARFGPGHETTG